MKSTILTLALMATFAFSHSQNAYETSMNKGLEMLHVSDNYETAYNCSNYFERIADANKKEWLPLYYAAYTSMASGFYETDADKKDALYQRGLTYIEKANAIQGDESEILALEAYIKLMYIANDAMKRAPSQTGEAIQLLEKAKSLNPNNPRPYLIQGQNTFYTPKFFGGGAQNALPLLEKANSLFQSFKPETSLMPDWGKGRCEKLLSECKEE